MASRGMPGSTPRSQVLEAGADWQPWSSPPSRHRSPGRRSTTRCERSRRSGAARTRGRTRSRRSSRAARRSGVDEGLNAAAAGLDHPLQLLLDVTMQMPLVPVPGDQARARQARQASACETDGRSAPTSRPRSLVGQRQRQGGCPPARYPPPPRRQGATASRARRTSSRGWEAIARWTLKSCATGGAPARRSSACMICGQGRTRSTNAGIQDREAVWHQRPPADGADQQFVRPRDSGWLDQRRPGPISSAAISRSPTRPLAASTPVGGTSTARPEAPISAVGVVDRPICCRCPRARR